MNHLGSSNYQLYVKDCLLKYTASYLVQHIVILQQPTTGSDDYSPEDSSPTPDNQCGIDTNEDRIFGGEETEVDEFPWMALLGYRTSK